MKKKNRGRIRGLITYAVILSLISGLTITFFVVKTYMNRDTSGTIIEGTKNNDYYNLRQNATTYQKEIYARLSSLLNNSGSETDIAGSVAQNFVADFYTWTNKISNTDVGGLQYLRPAIKGWVYQQALDQFYANVPYYRSQNELAQTLDVTGTNVTEVTATSYVSDAQSLKAFSVELTWTYKASTVVNLSDFPNKATIIMTVEDGRYNIVQLNAGTAGQVFVQGGLIA